MLNERENETDNKTRTPYLEVLKKASPQLFNVFLIFFVTLAVFPALHSSKKKFQLF